MALPKNREQSLKEVKKLVARFAAHEREFTRAGSAFNETQARTDFIAPFFRALGWDVDNEEGLPQDLREVFQEASLDIEDSRASKRPDYEFRLARQRKFYVEAKKPCVNIREDKSSAFQTRRYGFSAGLPVAALTNFNQLVIYDCVPVPDETDDARIARIKLFSYTEYEAHFDEIYDSLSREAVYSGLFDKTYGISAARQGTSQFDDYFLKQIRSWREKLAKDIYKRNSRLSEEELTYIVQRLLNRIIFLRICEDRDLEKSERLKALDEKSTYKDLKRLLQEADRKYDSGLFNLIDDPSLGIEVGSKVLVEIIKELYYPASPYTFAVVDASVLGQIYELLLAHSIRITAGDKVRLVEKPEVTESGGVISTPKYIVDTIAERTLGHVAHGKAPAELMKLRVGDIACGSGIFLLSTFEHLLAKHLDYYIRDGVADHNGKEIYEAGAGTWRLNLHEKQRILTSCIFGVDIDHQAVEVARFSLILKLIEGESNESIAANLAEHGERALPSLDRNVLSGNSLVSPEQFLDFKPAASKELLERVNPFDWGKAFPEVTRAGGFDAVIGNPPYIRIQNMVGYSPEEAEFFQSEMSGYQCARSDNFDKYHLFAERALNLLRPKGWLGYILPHKFTVIKSGEALRGQIAKGRLLRSVVHFGVQQVFSGSSTTYTCILLLEKSTGEKFTLEQVKDLATWRYGQSGVKTEYQLDVLTGKPWALIEGGASEVIQDLRTNNPTKLEDVAEIFVGVQTSRDKVYIVQPNSIGRSAIRFKEKTGKEWEIEKGILRPFLLDVALTAYSQPRPNAFIIFPYRISDGQAELYSPSEMASKFPLAWRYLNAHKEELRKRDIQNGTPSTWYRFGRSQSLTKFDTPKILINILSVEPRYAYDAADILVGGGGNGPYYLFRPRPESKFSIFFLQALLNNPLVEAIVKGSASTFRGGYYSHSKQFLKDLPVPALDLSTAKDRQRHDNIVKLVRKLISINESRLNAKTPAKQQLYKRLADALTDQLNAAVEKLYGLSKKQHDALLEER